MFALPDVVNCVSPNRPSECKYTIFEIIKQTIVTHGTFGLVANWMRPLPSGHADKDVGVPGGRFRPIR